MVILISGTTHTGKTALAQRMMEKYKIPYYSIDHIKMGLIRSAQTKLSVDDDIELGPYLWTIVKEIIKTAIENKQNLIVEGCYIPFDWKNDFDEEYLKDIRYRCLILNENYIENKFSDILKFENVVEHRLYKNKVSKYKLIDENRRNLLLCKQYGLDYVLIDKSYEIEFDLDKELL